MPKPLTRVEKRAGLKLLEFLRFVVRIRRAYLRKFASCLNEAACRIQQMFKMFRLRQHRRDGFIHALLRLETSVLRLSSRSRVQLFGEFSHGCPEGAWGVKLDCQFNEESKQFECAVRIRLGQKFKFIIDGGRDYAVSQAYIRTRDAAGNLNNVFLFH